MHVVRRINNNVILAEEAGKKSIVIGKGIGFKVYPDDSVDTTKIEQTFVSQIDSEFSYWEEILRIIPLPVLSASKKVLELANHQLNKALSENFIITLSDHIVFAMKRLREGIILIHPLSWEIQQYYPEELAIAKQSLSIINDALNIKLTEDEIPFLAIHFVNAQINASGELVSVSVIDVIEHSVTILKYHFQLDIDQTTNAFARFVAHFKYYIMRQLKKEVSNNEIDSDIIAIVKMKYKKDYACAQKIANYLAKNYKTRTDENELVYLSLHINRLVQEN